MIRYSTFLILVFTFFNSNASTIVDIRPLTNEILVVHFDEGSINHAKNGSFYQSAVANANPLNTNLAVNLNSYSIQSNEDEHYALGKSPVNINRKSKPTDIAFLCEGWELLPEYDVFGCKNSSLDHAKEHWLYLYLSQPLKNGITYRISVNEGLSSQTEFEIEYNETVLRSDAIHINNIGYSTRATAKYAYVYHWLGDGGSIDLTPHENALFEIIDINDQQVVYTGNLAFRADPLIQETFQENAQETPNQNFNGSYVYECDFSDLNREGTYVLVIEGIGSSYTFEIACDVFNEPFKWVMRGIYNNRSGISIPASEFGAERPAPHNPERTPGFSGKLKYTSTTVCEVSDSDASIEDSLRWVNNIKGELNSWGWYQDAGDWDAYIEHFKVPSILMFTYEHFNENFHDGQLSIMENQNGIPDILDEARWLIRFYKRLKDETESKAWTTGGVPGGRIFPDLF
ncbi:MAG: cellulase N-terminal Ig-like domain-containing protein [Bacteroidota bacterium]